MSFGLGGLTSQKLTNDPSKPVIMTAANNRYFVPLMRVLKNIRAYFKDNLIIVYDLGIKAHNVKKLKKVCHESNNCEIRQFDVGRVYSRKAPHVLDMYTYSWKPIIIQVSLYFSKRVYLNGAQIVQRLTRLLITYCFCWIHALKLKKFSEFFKDQWGQRSL